MKVRSQRSLLQSFVSSSLFHDTQVDARIFWFAGSFQGQIFSATFATRGCTAHATTIGDSQLCWCVLSARFVHLFLSTQEYVLSEFCTNLRVAVLLGSCSRHSYIATFLHLSEAPLWACTNIIFHYLDLFAEKRALLLGSLLQSFSLS